MAWSGDGFAQIIAWNIYGDDNFDRKDEEKSLFWVKQAADQEHPQGLSHLGSRYVLDGLEKEDKAEIENGIQLLRTGSDRGFSWSQNWLAWLSFLQFDGEDFGVDKTEARELASKSFKNRFSQSGVLLGEMYEEGFGTDVDLKRAESIYLSAFEMGDTGGEAAYRVAMLKLSGEDEDRKVSVVKWLQEAYEEGYPASVMFLAVMYRDGAGVEPDKVRAAELYIEAADDGNAEAQKIVGDLFYEGVGVPKDDVTARAWYLRAIESGNSDAYQGVMKSRWSWDAYQNFEKRGFTVAKIGGYAKNLFFLPGDLLTFFLSGNKSIQEFTGVSFSTYGGWPVGIFSAFFWIVIAGAIRPK